MATIFHPSLYLQPMQCNFASPSIKRQLLHPWVWADVVTSNRMWQKQFWKVQSLGFKRLITTFLFVESCYCQASWRRREDPRESDFVFPVTSTEPSNHLAPFNPPVDHRYISELSQGQPSQPSPGFPSYSSPKCQTTELRIKLVIVILNHYVVGLFVL